MKKTLAKTSKKCFLDLDFKEIIRKRKLIPLDFSEYNNLSFLYFVYNCPNKENEDEYNVNKIDFIKQYNFRKNTNDKMMSLFKELDVKDVYSFNTYSTNNQNAEDLVNKFNGQKGNCCFYYNDQSIVKSFFIDLRNAICHCNIFKRNNDKYYYFLSMSKTGKVKFYLKIDNLNNFKKLVYILEKYRTEEEK